MDTKANETVDQGGWGEGVECEVFQIYCSLNV